MSILELPLGVVPTHIIQQQQVASDKCGNRAAALHNLEPKQQNANLRFVLLKMRTTRQAYVRCKYFCGRALETRACSLHAPASNGKRRQSTTINKHASVVAVSSHGRAHATASIGFYARILKVAVRAARLFSAAAQCLRTIQSRRGRQRGGTCSVVHMHGTLP
eukprot:6179534-Pleurochrysis_carterae.AAC.7